MMLLSLWRNKDIYIGNHCRLCRFVLDDCLHCAVLAYCPTDATGGVSINQSISIINGFLIGAFSWWVLGGWLSVTVTFGGGGV